LPGELEKRHKGKVVLAEVQEEVLSESMDKSHRAQVRPRRRMGRRSRRLKGRWCLEVWFESAGVRDRFSGVGSRACGFGSTV
jgi:hypothetical protein